MKKGVMLPLLFFVAREKHRTAGLLRQNASMQRSLQIFPAGAAHPLSLSR